MPASPDQGGKDAPAKPTADVNRLRYDSAGARRHAEADRVAVEEPLAITLAWRDQGGALQRRVFTVTMRTPGNDGELAAGLLLSEGVIRRAQRRVALQVADLDGRRREGLLDQALDFGGIDHGGGEKFHDWEDPAYRDFLRWIEFYAQCQQE